METVNDSRSLFCRVFFTRTGFHFARKRFSAASMRGLFALGPRERSRRQIRAALYTAERGAGALVLGRRIVLRVVASPMRLSNSPACR